MLSVILALGACDQTPAFPVLAQFLGGEGNVFLVTENRRSELQGGTKLHPGQTVETAEEAIALLSLLPNMAVQLNASTAVTIRDARLAKNGNAMVYPVRGRRAKVHLLRGSLAAVTPPGFTQAELRVRVAGAEVIAPERSAFFVDCRGDRTRVTNSAGRLTLAARGREMTPLPPGYYVDLSSSGGLIAEPRLSVVDESAAEQAAAATDAQQLVADLTTQLRGAPPPWRRK